MNNHLVSDNIATLQIYNAQMILQGMTNNVMFTFIVMTLHGPYTINIEQDEWNW